MAHWLVDQLRFTRSEWMRGLEGITADEACRHFPPMNCISWLIGHMAWHEQLYWLQRAQGIILIPEVMHYANGEPQTSPSLEQVQTSWHTIVQATEEYLDSLTSDLLETHLQANGRRAQDNIGTYLMRMIYHYWFHLGEMQAIRQMLGHSDLPVYIGDISKQPYRKE